VVRWWWWGGLFFEAVVVVVVPGPNDELSRSLAVKGLLALHTFFNTDKGMQARETGTADSPQFPRWPQNNPMAFRMKLDSAGPLGASATMASLAHWVWAKHVRFSGHSLLKPLGQGWSQLLPASTKLLPQ
jgi:hypothetical protein